MAGLAAITYPSVQSRDACSKVAGGVQFSAAKGAGHPGELELQHASRCHSCRQSCLANDPSRRQAVGRFAYLGFSC